MAVISQRTVVNHLQRADQAVGMHKGNAFTDCVEYVIGQIPGLSVRHKNAIDNAHAQEIDLGVFNERRATGLSFLPPILLVECKGWDGPIGAPAIRDFVTKLRERGLTFGIIASAHGITGDAEALTAAQNAVAAALQDGISIIVLTRAELESLRSGAALVGLVKSKLCALACIRAAI